MPTLIVTTKLFVPRPLPGAVPRPRLLDFLNAGVGRKLTLISAPAGFGKSTLVSEWIAGCACSAAWLALDERDNDITRFLAYLIAALQTIRPAIGERELRALHSPQPPPVDVILGGLVNQLTDEFVLVLDDYHVIDSHSIDDALAFLLDHLPAQVHLVITTREDPRLPLARLRARGQMNELRAADLRFDHAEAADFLTRVMGCTLAADEIAALEARTEGWIAGLQLAALSMRGRANVHAFVQAFAGDNRYVVDYLVDEVLQHQPDDARRFLLQTSLLDRLCGPLCDAVTGQTGSSLRLIDLDRSNLFVIPLDDKRHWFRYHHLFADVLRAHLLEESPQEVSALHRRASTWYAQNGQPAAAIQHALAAADYEGAAALIELAWPAMDATFQTAAWLAWAQTLPDDLVRGRPVLSAAYAWALLNSGKLEEAEARLQDAERWLDVDMAAAMNRPPGRVVADEEQFRTLAATIATGRAFFAQAHGNVAATVDYGRRALELLPQDDYLRRGIAAALLGVAYWAGGDLELAHRTLASGMADLRTAGNVLFALRGTYVLADIRLAQGRLRDAIQTYAEALRLAAEHGEHVLRGAADLHLRLSELYREQDNQPAAREHFEHSAALGEQAASPFWRYRQCLARARICEAEGDLDGALRSLDAAEQCYVRGPVPELRPIAALKARVWIAQGAVAAALDWARDAGLAADDEPEYLLEFEHVILARALIAAFRQTDDGSTIRVALGLLERLLRAAQAGGRMGSALELLILQALARAAQDDIPGALEPLRRALALAEPESYIRIFVDEGQPMAHLLAAAADHGIMPDYSRRLLAAFESGPGQKPPIAPQHATSLNQPLIEPLSPREREVLGLVAQGLSNRDIAKRLYLALSTVKGHNRVIFEKLQVQRRTEAVARARELGLL